MKRFPSIDAEYVHFVKRFEDDVINVGVFPGHRAIAYRNADDLGGDCYVCKVAKNVDEAKTLVESGFDYVTDIDGMKLFRKRK
jgi:hypothetical protein